jgi:hypothetical protein
VAPSGVEGRDVVVVARESIRGAGSPDLVEEIRGLLAEVTA